MLRDLLNGLRAARRNPGFTAAAVVLVGLGVGANAAIFTVARTLVFRPLPFENPERLVSLWRESRQTGAPFGASWPHLAEWRSKDYLFDGVAAYMYSGTYASADSSGSEFGAVSELQVTEGFFRVLGVRPARGRLFSSDELQPETGIGAVGPVVVSHDFWHERLLGRADVLGQFVKVGASTRMIVGVLPRGFRIFRNDVPEVFSPLRPFPGHLSDRRMTYLETIARLRPAFGIKQAQAEFEAYSRLAETAHPHTDAGLVWRLDDLRDRLFGSKRPAMTLLLGTVGVVLLIACGNLAILLVVRAVRRRREIAIRAALGAGRARIARQLLTESLVLSLAGGMAGLLLAVWATDLLAAFCLEAGIGLPRMTVDGTVAGFALLISIATGTVFGAAPVWHAWKVDLNESLRPAGPAASKRVVSCFPGSTIAVAEIALSMVLLAGAGLLFRSFTRLNKVDPGFRAENAIAVTIGKAPYTAGFHQREAAFWTRLLEGVEAMPGVGSAAFSGALPLADPQGPENMKARVMPEGRTAPGYLQAEYQDVSPGYFRAMGIPLRSGRTFEDLASDASAAVINEAFARECWGTEDPAGRRIQIPGGRPYTIVGVVGDVRQYSLGSAPPRRQIYRPLGRSDVAALSKWPAQYLVVRMSGSPEGIAPRVKELVRSIDPGRQVMQVRSMKDLVFRSTAWDRLKMTVVSLFSMSALLLTLVGVYAVVSHSVSQRQREIGIRIALGGQPGGIRLMMLRQGITVVIAGLGIGIAASFALAPLVSNHLFEVSATDVSTLAGASLLLAATGLTACYLPIRSATETDAAIVLRSE